VCWRGAVDERLSRPSGQNDAPRWLARVHLQSFDESRASLCVCADAPEEATQRRVRFFSPHRVGAFKARHKVKRPAFLPAVVARGRNYSLYTASTRGLSGVLSRRDAR
jgi:hypothetical protein